jgi:hypothetical protein
VIPVSRVVLAGALAVLMVVSGTATYIVLASRTSKVAAAPEKPTVASPRAQALTLPGTLYLSQDGAIYSLSVGRFHQLTQEVGWTQPSLTPDGNIIAVRQQPYFSDVYVLSPYGSILRRVTSNNAPPHADPGANHWAFYPRLSPDGRTLWLTYDKPKYDYDVVFSVWAMPYTGTIAQGKLWSNAADYTGGDVQPVPVPGGVIYTKYDYASRYDVNQESKLVGMLWFTNRAFSTGRMLTRPNEDCRNPSLSPDGTQVAMVCTYQKQISYLTVASWNGSTLGPRTSILTSQLVAQPTWAPDGSGIAYLAPAAGSTGPFQLWWLPKAFYAPPPAPVPTPTPGGPHNGPLPTPTPSPAVVVKPIEVTTNNGFDATSPLAWG